MLAHVVRDVVIDLSRELVPQRPRIAVGADRTVHRLPRLELIRRPAVTAEHCLEAAELARRPEYLPLRRASKWTLGAVPLTERHREGVRVGIDVRLLVVAEVDRVWLQHVRAAEEVWVLQHHRQRLPAARRRTL